ncbi:MAG: CapA family protein [Firmicutes bacterium]|nr:CapA family protein [Bacillota bacterium]
MTKLKKKAKKRILLILVLIVLLLGFFGSKYIFNNSNTSSPSNFEEHSKPEDPIKTYTAKLIATGDGLVHSTVYKAAYDNSTESYDFSGMLTYTKNKLKDYDIKYYNQETVFDDTEAYGGYPRFNTPSDFGKSMIEAGFNVVSLATNHSMDRGADSAKRSTTWWKEQKGILTNGMATSEEMRTDYQIMEANGITYTMLSYTYGTNGLGASEIKAEPYLVNLYDEELVKNDIEAVRDKVDILIVAMHWGNEYQQNASDTQRKQAKFLAENGVDIVLGTHSHCIQPWEMIEDTVVFYSFGNFISNQMGAEQALVRKVGVIGMFATLDITKVVDTEKNTTTITLDNIGADLNYTYRYYNSIIGRYDYKVIPFSQIDSDYLTNYESIYNEFSEVLKKYDDSINIEPLPEVMAN